MSILETLEELVDELRGSRPSTKHGINEHTLHAATQFSSSLRDHFDASSQFREEQVEIENKEQALSQARKEMERLKGDIARLKAQLQEM
jgi:chromosome segregation ATPase